MATASAALLRSVGSDQVRHLARSAVDQGWDLYPTGGGHLAVVNPANGAQVTLSRNAGGGHSIANTRQAFARAGLDLRSRTERRRAHRQEVRSMHVREATHAEVNGAAAPPILATGPHPFLDSGETKPDSRGRLQRQCATCGHGARSSWHRVQERVEATDRHRERVQDEEAQVEDAPLRGDRERVQVSERLVAYAAPNPDTESAIGPDQLPEDVQEEAAAVLDGLDRAGFHVVQADPEEFPLARSLAALEDLLAPGLFALEAAGKRDAADLVRAELVRTPLEEELVRLYRRVMTGA